MGPTFEIVAVDHQLGSILLACPNGHVSWHKLMEVEAHALGAQAICPKCRFVAYLAGNTINLWLDGRNEVERASGRPPPSAMGDE